MIIIVEGLDGVGKTTFVQRFLRTCDATVLHSGPPSPGADPFEEYERRLYPALDQRENVICDRWHWGERAYGPVLRGQDRLGVPGWRHVELFLKRWGAVVVYLHQPKEVLVDRLRSRGDALVTSDVLPAIELGYQWCLRNTVLPVVALRDANQVDITWLTDLAFGYAGAWDTEVGGTYIGPTEPDFLLFGEKRRDPDSPDWSAFVPRRTTSGYYLLQHLPERIWGRTGLCNALEEPDPRRTWEEAGRPPTVALGRWAHIVLEQYDVPHGTVPHPQFVRRFHHGRLPVYGQLIERTLGTQEHMASWRGEPVLGVSLEDGTPLPASVSTEE